MRFRPTIVVLAAGQGRRFAGSRHKLEQTLEGGVSVLAKTLANALQTGLPVVVVTTERLGALVAEQLAHRDTIIVSDADARRGMGHSIAAGVNDRSTAPGWLVLPGDMPMVRPATLQAVAAAIEHHPVAYAQYRGRRGHPVGFAAELYSELAALQGDEGARRLVARYPAFAVDVDDAGVLVDVDTVGDLEALRATLAETREHVGSSGGAAARRAVNESLAAAIRDRRRIHFVYNGKPRLAEPQCYGIGAKGSELLRVHQLQGGSEREPLFDVAKISELVVLDERFAAPGPHYKRNDSAMRHIHCQL